MIAQKKFGFLLIYSLIVFILISQRIFLHEKRTNNSKDETNLKFFINNGSYIPQKTNILPYKILHSPKEPLDEIEIIFGIKTVSTKRPRRDAIRRSFGNANLYKHKFKVKFVFLLGQKEMDENHEILEELKLHDDILYGEFKENYWNLTVKEQMFFSWTTQNAPNVKFVYRGDDDTFLNPLKILEFFDEKWDLADDEAAMWGMKFGSGYDSTIEKQEFRDKMWPYPKYPAWVSGSGGFLNRKALFMLQSQMQLIPFIIIDDVFEGIVFKKMDLEHRIFHDERFLAFPIEENTPICKLISGITLHYAKFDYECMLDAVFQYASKCKENPNIRSQPSCFFKNWYASSLEAPLFRGPKYAPLAKPELEEPIDLMENGSCCSPAGHCVARRWDCDCRNCSDGKKVARNQRYFENHVTGKSCCPMIKVINTDKLHRGIYLRASVNGTIVYQSARKEGKIAKARIQFGDLGEGNMWYASILFGDNYAAYYGRGFYAWVKDSGNEKCPPPTKLEGNGGEIVCFHGILKDPY